MPKLHPFPPCAALLLAAASAAAQSPATEPGPLPVPVHSPAWVGGLVDDRLRLAQLLSGAPTGGYLLRSPSTDLVRLTAGAQGAAWG
ncbi:MAG TPA: hypothetical protein VGV85_12875, partial [Longimicrobiaceae bacterium]|nr:hypothetical protein [Longimicrobiaceae bacterium]